MTVTNKDKNTIINVDTDSNVVHKTGDETVGGTKTISGEINGNIKLNTPQGHMLNGKIVTSVSGGALTVAIKTLAGNDPSTSDPVYVRIGNGVRAITISSYCYDVGGANSLNLASVELVNQDTDVFIYAIWNTSINGVRFLFSRIPYAKTISDFVILNTHEKGVVSGNNPTWNIGDEVEVIGRFNVSMNNSYQWSIPATSVIINRPIFNTRSLTFSPQVIGTSVSGTGQIYTARIGRYLISDNMMDIRGNLKLSDYGSASGFLGITIPMTVSNIGGGQDKTEITGYACDVGQAPMTANKGNPTTYGGANAVYWHNSVDTNNLSISGCNSNTVFRFASRVEV